MKNLFILLPLFSLSALPLGAKGDIPKRSLPSKKRERIYLYKKLEAVNRKKIFITTVGTLLIVVGLFLLRKRYVDKKSREKQKLEEKLNARGDTKKTLTALLGEEPLDLEKLQPRFSGAKDSEVNNALRLDKLGKEQGKNALIFLLKQASINTNPKHLLTLLRSAALELNTQSVTLIWEKLDPYAKKEKSEIEKSEIEKGIDVAIDAALSKDKDNENNQKMEVDKIVKMIGLYASEGKKNTLNNDRYKDNQEMKAAILGVKKKNDSWLPWNWFSSGN